jgi:hypothetical protein
MQCFHTMQHAAASKPAACMLCLVHAMPATVSSPKNDPYYKKMIENQDPRSHSLSLSCCVTKLCCIAQARLVSPVLFSCLPALVSWLFGFLCLPFLA